MSALVVGSGWARHAASAFAARADTQARGVVARGSPRSSELARALGVPLFDRLEDAIATTSPRLAVVAVGERCNASLTRELLVAGANVLCAHPVAREPDEVLALSAVAKGAGLAVSTDYSLRATDAFRAGRARLPGLGALMRIAITFPGRFLPIALDLAVALGGRVAAVSAFGRYPEVLSARRSAAPAAFPPTIVLEHAGGAVSALSPAPHAAPASAVRVTTSGTKGRLDLELPAGGTRLVRCNAGGSWQDEWLAAPAPRSDAATIFAAPMVALANDFVDAVVSGGPVPCPLDEEASLRSIWNTIPLALRARGSVAVPAT